MIRVFLLILLFMACSSPHEHHEELSKTVPADNEYLNPFDDIITHRNFERARDTLAFYLKDIEYDTSLFRHYEMLVRSYMHMYQFDQADSIMQMIDRKELTGHNERAFISFMFELEMQASDYESALKYLDEEKKYFHDGFAPPEINESIFYFDKWKVFSIMKQCDSSRTYLKKYLRTVHDTPKMMEYHWLDEEKLNYYAVQLESECPLIDSVGMSTPVVTIIKYQ